MQAEQQSERDRFEAWAKDEGYDVANTYDTERSQWVWLNPMTADLWTSWHAALSHPSTPQGWQPIETAPDDGTEVLAWRADCGAFIASYTSPDAFPMTQEELDVCDEDWLFHSDWFTQWPQAIRLEGSEVPTHWMPLPSPPEQGSKG